MAYDAIVVGARCAGAPTAMLLARRGHRVLLVDRVRFPRDTISTHHLHQQGVARLARWGLLERLRAAGCEPVQAARMVTNDVELVGQLPPYGDIRQSFCPRRTVIDTLLVEAAAEAGAEVRENFTVTGLVWADGRVVGVRGRAGGREVDERATIVVGADGVHSRVAREVQPLEYKTVPSLTVGYYSYWSGVSRGEVETYPLPHRLVLVFPTNDEAACVYVGWPHAEFPAFRSDIEGGHRATVAMVPAVADRLAAGRREEPFRGTAHAPNYYRRPWGPGWALVGDAGYHRDQTTGQGMSDAFRDAEYVADAVHTGLLDPTLMEQELAGYERRRNEETRDGYSWALEAAALRPVSERVTDYYRAARDDPHEVSRILGAIYGTVPFREVFSRRNLDRFLGPTPVLDPV